jgi:hypothetical protein
LLNLVNLKVSEVSIAPWLAEGAELNTLSEETGEMDSRAVDEVAEVSVFTAVDRFK